MAAALGLHLVFDVHAGRSGGGKLSHGTAQHERRPKSRVRVHQQRQVARARNAANVLHHVVQRRHAEVRQAKGGVSDARAGKIDGGKPAMSRQQRRISVDCANHLQGTLRVHGGAKSLSRRLAFSRYFHCLLRIGNEVIMHPAFTPRPRSGKSEESLKNP